MPSKHPKGFICYFTARERKQRLIGLSHLIFCGIETKDTEKQKSNCAPQVWGHMVQLMLLQRLNQHQKNTNKPTKCYWCLNSHTMQIDGATDSKERMRRRGGGGVIACLCCAESNLRAIKRRGRPTALRFAFWKPQAGKEKSLGTAPDPIGHFYWTTTVFHIRPTLVEADWQRLTNWRTNNGKNIKVQGALTQFSKVLG